ncbi:hypothetical protein BRE01_64270 [Brevibacillus reuszeri]|uniref:Uncharacterized protein n=1 Tax=Brevibacillus reuszeri TaxID=54915 RepID=A0A0K9YW63_9BACL|nr:hypothetical protein [Brevibacillus reuszeri]KNB72918.1 hypothetical protein ADS79_13905 [Brevibacillus reuszeri]MED1861715.1 hypothetical protein [Brevibacillus reuszeri]GED72725.1 hypothetical protein BRE01_64270 [Brevibacillus reuszeri]
MSSPPTLEALDVKIEKTVKEFDDFKQDIKEEMKEIKTSIKDSEKLFNETIVTMRESDASMKENIKWLTTIAQQQREELTLIREIKVDPKNSDDIHTKWYQGFISGDRKNLWIVVLILLCALLGYKAQDIISFLV